MVPITPERYSALCSARSTLIDAGAFEQRYEILLGNYIAFETFCAEWSLRSDIEMDHRYETWAMVILEGNRHVMNLLSAARSYADHVVRDFQHLSLSPSFKDQATSFTHGGTPQLVRRDQVFGWLEAEVTLGLLRADLFVVLGSSIQSLLVVDDRFRQYIFRERDALGVELFRKFGASVPDGQPQEHPAPDKGCCGAPLFVPA